MLRRAGDEFNGLESRSAPRGESSEGIFKARVEFQFLQTNRNVNRIDAVGQYRLKDLCPELRSSRVNRHFRHEPGRDYWQGAR